MDVANSDMFGENECISLEEQVTAAINPVIVVNDYDSSYDLLPDVAENQWDRLSFGRSSGHFSLVSRSPSLISLSSNCSIPDEHLILDYNKPRSMSVAHIEVPKDVVNERKFSLGNQLLPDPGCMNNRSISQEVLKSPNDSVDTKKKHKHMHKFLEVFQPNRKKSKSTGNLKSKRKNSPGHGGLFGRRKSHLEDSHLLKSLDKENSKVNPGLSNNCIYIPPMGDSKDYSDREDELSSTPKYHKKKKANQKLEHYIYIPHMGESNDYSDSEDVITAIPEHIKKKKLNRQRSNSDSGIVIDLKKAKRKSDDKRVYVFQAHKRSKQRGSLPELNDESIVNTRQLTDFEYYMNQHHLKKTKLSKLTQMNELSKSATNLGDIAVHDHFAGGEDTVDHQVSSQHSDLGFHNDFAESTKERDYPGFYDIPQKGKKIMDNIWSAIRRKQRTYSGPTIPFKMEIPSYTYDPDGGKENVSPIEKNQTENIPPSSPPTMTYTVKNNDTLTSLAARFDTTPSELTKMNRLATRFLFPGQTLLVPDKDALFLADTGGGGGGKTTSDKGGGTTETSNNQQNKSATLTQRGSIKEGSLERDSLSTPPVSGGRIPPSSPRNCPRTPANSLEIERSIDRECIEKFLKIGVKHITDGQGVVAGVLLVTPNAVMFDPNVSDPLVIERGSESYGVIAPMDFVVNAALYHDIAHMKVKDSSLPRPDIPTPEIYYGPNHETAGQDSNQESPGKDLSLTKDSTFPELTTSHDDNDSSCSCGGETRETSVFPKAFDHEILTPIESETSPPNNDGKASSQQDASHGTRASPRPTTGASQQVTEGSSFGAASNNASSGVASHPGHSSQPPLMSDLTPIIESLKLEETSPTSEPQLAQTQCDTSKAHSIAQNDQNTSSRDGSIPSDKKRATSVTFNVDNEPQVGNSTAPGSSTEGTPETRKQKVLKRLSYPLSWMESFGGDKDPVAQQQHLIQQHLQQHQQQQQQQQQQQTQQSASAGTSQTTSQQPPVQQSSVESDSGKSGILSNVFSMSGVSNMLSRRPSLDFARRQFPQASSLTSMTTSSSQSQTPPSNGQGNVLHEPQSQKRAQYKDGPKFGLKSMVSMDDMPELFASFDKLIPKPAQSTEDPPLYLCLRMGKPKDKPVPKNTPIMSYGKKKMRPEYWFSIPKPRADGLFNFFQLWAEDIYGEINLTAIEAKGFILLEDEIDVWPEDEVVTSSSPGSTATEELTEITKESWEHLPMNEELRRALNSSGSMTSLDLEVFLPDIIGNSEIITDAIRKNMFKKLPARAQGYAWKLVFSTAQNGFSLNSLYRKMGDVDSPVMIFIQDTDKNIFGALVSCALKVSELFYGTGESFIFSCEPEFKIYPWTGENTFFVKGNNESIAIGGGDGGFGIWLDGDLYQGRTQPCKTYNNPKLTSNEDFIIKTIECWCFE